MPTATVIILLLQEEREGHFWEETLSLALSLRIASADSFALYLAGVPGKYLAEVFIERSHPFHPLQ